MLDTCRPHRHHRPDHPRGQQLRDAGGKRRYTKNSFATQEAREKRSRAILAALADAGIAGGAR